MCSCWQDHLGELSTCLKQLRESWNGEGQQTGAAQIALLSLLDKVEVADGPSSPPTSPAPPASQTPAPAVGAEGDAGCAEASSVPTAQILVLLNVARLVLSPNNGGGAERGSRATPPRARSRALSLDCLRLGLLLRRLGPRRGGSGDDGVRGEDEGLGRSALAVAAVGGRDERWEVRAAAARAGGEALRSLGRDTLLALLSSGQDCWLPAMVVDGYPEVEAAARAALSPDPVFVRNSGSDDKANNSKRHTRAAPTPPPLTLDTLPSVFAAFSPAAAVLHGAYEALSTATTVSASGLFSGLGDGGVAGPRFVDLGAEETVRTALRALRGGVTLLRSPPGVQEMHTRAGPSSPVPLTPQQQQQRSFGDVNEGASALQVQALELIEAWLGDTLAAPPGPSVPWADGAAQSVAAASVGSAPGGSLTLEARDAVRALLIGGARGGTFRDTSLDAAAAVVEEFASESSRSAVITRDCGRWDVGEEREQELWRRVYCGLLVRLETCFQATVASQEQGAAQDTDQPVASEQSGSSPRSGGDGSNSIITTNAAAASDLSPFIRLAEMIAEALGEVPFAFEQAVPRFLDQDDNMPVLEKKALRAQGGRRQRWMISCANLLLQAGNRLCELFRRHIDPATPTTTAAGSEGERRELATAAVVKLLVSALAYQQPATRADDPAEAWLSCVQHGGFLANPATRAPATTARAAAVELTTPIPWASCVHGQALSRHELPAPWASSPVTVKLATELVSSAWGALAHGGVPVAERNAEALMKALRAAVRARGGWRNEAGLGIKHAVSAAIRRIRFPLVGGATLGHALPLVLPLADDYDPAHQAVGFSLLLHLGAEATPTELGWHRGLLLEVLERGIRGGGRDPASSALCLAAVVRLLRHAPRNDGGSDSDSGGGGSSPGRAGIRVAREALAQASRATDGVVTVVMVCGAAALLELPATGDGYAPCELLRPALLCLLPILQSSPVSTMLDARAASLRAVLALCLSCWPRVHAHASKLLCALLWTCGDCARRALVRERSSNGTTSAVTGRGGDGGNGDGTAALPLGVVVAANHAAIDASTDEAVQVHATRLGALVLLLAGDNGGGGGGGGDGGGKDISSARATLRKICSAIAALRPAGSAMEELADRALTLGATWRRETIATTSKGEEGTV